MVAIAEQGDVIERLARFLLSKGYTPQDVWREIKKLPFVCDAHTLGLLNTATDITNGFPWNEPLNPKEGLRQQLKAFKRLKKAKTSQLKRKI